MSSAGSLSCERGGVFPFAAHDAAKAEVIAVWGFWRVLKKRLKYAGKEKVANSRHGM